MTDSSYFVFRQNNSGGLLDIDDNISKWVIIQAKNHNNAITKAKKIGIYFDPKCKIDCSCCGSRWQKDCDEHLTLESAKKSIRESDDNLIRIHLLNL